MLVTAEEAALSGAQSRLAGGVECGGAPRAPVQRQVGVGVSGVRQACCRLYEWEAAELSALY